jgi:phosphoribosylformylglycinamidine (FGAM) synthase-like enzyme
MTVLNESAEERKWRELAQGFGLSAEEFARLKECLRRDPSLEEIAVAGALWSEHCSYKSSRVHLARFHTQEPWVLQGPGENAGIVEIAPGVGLAFKMESHNHPSYIEPYQGAATGVGGILRDVFCMGARPVANLNCLRYGEGEYNAHLLKHTVRGIGDYGNSVGVPTVGGQTRFHYGYSKNILVNAFTAGLVKSDAIFRGKLQNDNAPTGTQKPSGLVPGTQLTNSKRKELFPDGANLLLYFGSATGRDGVHGATMSSDTFDDSTATLKPTVQVGDPFAEKKLLEVTLELLDKKLCVGLQDMGAAGLTSSGVEMAGRSGCGVALDLNLIPARTARLKPYEYLLSESQERMLCAVTPENAAAVLELCKKHQVAAAIIGSVNNTGEFICIHNDAVACALPVDVLTENAPKYAWPLQDRSEYLKNHLRIENRSQAPSGSASESTTSDRSKKTLQLVLPESTREELAHIFEGKQIPLSAAWDKILPHMADWFHMPTQSSKEPLTRHYCSTVQGNTLAGCQTPRTSAAAVVRLDDAYCTLNMKNDPRAEAVPAIALVAGCQERWIEIDPLNGSAQSTLLLARRIAASGARPLAMTDCLNFGSPRQPAVMRQISDAIDGINSVAKTMHIPIVSGNVSLNNQTGNTPIPPTPMVGMVGVIDRANEMIEDSHPLDSKLFWLRAHNMEKLTAFESSEWAWNVFKVNAGPVPGVDFKHEQNLWSTLAELCSARVLAACSCVGVGGMLATVMTLAARRECAFSWSPAAMGLSLHESCAEGQAGVLVSLTSSPQAETRLAACLEKHKLEAIELGSFVKAAVLKPDQQSAWEQIGRSYSKSLKPFFE